MASSSSSSFLQTIVEEYDGPSSSSSSASPWHSGTEGDSSSSSSSSSTGSRKLRGGLGSHRKIVGGGGSNEGDIGGTNEEQSSSSPSLLLGAAASTSATPISVKEVEGEEAQTEETAKGLGERRRGEARGEEGGDLAEIERLTSELQRVRGLLSKKDYDHNLLKLDVENTKVRPSPFFPHPRLYIFTSFLLSSFSFFNFTFYSSFHSFFFSFASSPHSQILLIVFSSCVLSFFSLTSQVLPPAVPYLLNSFLILFLFLSFQRDLFVLRNYLETLKTLFSPSEEDAERLVWANSIHTNPGGGNVVAGAEGGGANVVHNGMQPPALTNVSNVRSKGKLNPSLFFLLFPLLSYFSFRLEHKRERSLSTTDSALSSSSPLVKTTSDALEEASSSSSSSSSSPLLLPPLPSSGSEGGGKVSNSPNIRAQMSISTSVLPSIPSITSIHDMAPFSQTLLRQHTHAQEELVREGEKENRRWEEKLSLVETELKELVEQFKAGIEEATKKQEEGALSSYSPLTSITSSEEVEELRKEIERLGSDLRSKEEEHTEAVNSKKSLEEALELLRKEVKKMEGKVEESEGQSNWAREMAIQAVQALADEKRVLEEGETIVISSLCTL
jgi:hypothetical protein